MNESALEGFVRIVELNSFSAAADALYLSQSALSQQIRTLEGQLQFELFQHVPRKVVLTPEGQDFYPKAKQMIALYQEAVAHARALKQKAAPPLKHLLIGGCHTSMQMFGFDLFALTSDLCLQYTPILRGCANRSDVWRSLKRGETDISFQLESTEFYAQGLTFIPLFYMPELCIPIHAPADMPVGKLTFEQALQYRWLPAKEMMETIYETNLLQEGISCGVEYTPIGAMRSAPYGEPILKMVPLFYYRRPDFSFVRVLDWGRGHRFGVVIGQKANDPTVMGYVHALQEQLPPLSQKLFGMELEAIPE